MRQLGQSYWAQTRTVSMHGDVPTNHLSVLDQEFSILLFLQLKNDKGEKKLNSAQLKLYYHNGQAMDLCK